MAHCRMLDTSPVGDDLREFSYRLINEHLFLPDILADVKRLMDVTAMTFNVSQQPFALVDDKNKMGGVFFISDVVPGHEATLYIWIWGKCYTATTHRFILGYIEHYAEEYQLARVVCRTPDDKRLGRLLERLFFKLEGRFRSGYKSGGKCSTLFQYRRLFGGVV